MNEPKASQRDDRLEALLDGLLEGEERAAVEETVRGDAELRRQAELQGRIDAGMGRLFRVEPPADGPVAAQIAAQLRAIAPAEKARPMRWRWAAAALAAAAAAAWLVIGAPMGRGPSNAPLFAARPLADVYRETVADGFEPYYECREADRFAETFERRQGRALRLLPMPPGSRMLGLSYPGGLSRDTTAMLCRVDGQPVMVFVDRAEADQPEAAANADSQANVFREERDGLVFYEVTPFDRPRVVDLLAPAD